MGAPGWPAVKQLFEEAEALAADERNRFLERLRTDDPTAAAEIESLLAAAGEADPFFEELADEIRSRPPWLEDADAGGDGPDPLIGQSVRQYEIKELLGRGGMGVVYRARDTRLDRTVALKFLPPHLSADEAATDRFMVEARAAAALDHPNICNVHEIAEDDEGRLFIAMALYEGETLKQKIARGPLPIDEALDYTRQIAAGLQAAHDREIIHRDIKPGNVIVTHDGLAKILDFGLAKLTDVTLTGSKATMGTVAYLSPEQARGQPLDHRTDLWSLGVVLYEILTGERPFEGDRSAVVIYRILSEEPAPVSTVRPEVPPEVEALVDRLLAKNADGRLESAGAVAQALVRRDTIGVLQPTPRRLGQRLGMRAALATAAALLIAVLAAWWLIISTSSTRTPAAVEEGPIRSLAVLPLLSTDPAQRDFVDAMHHALITALAQVLDMRVIARQSTLEYGETDKPITEIAEELGTDALIEGTVVRIGDQVAIAATLTRAEPEEQLWAARLEGPADEFLDLSEDVAREVAAVVAVPLRSEGDDRLASMRDVDPEAYTFFTRGHEYLNRSMDSDDAKAAIQMYERAIEVDPDFAAAHGMLAYALRHRAGMPPFQSVGDSSAHAIDRAMALDANLPEAHLALLRYSGDPGDYEAALRGGPTPYVEAEIHRAMAIHKRQAGEWDEAIALRLRSLELNPRSASLLLDITADYVMTRNYEGWEAAVERAIALAPDEPSHELWYAYLLLSRDGDAEGTRQSIARAAELDSPSALLTGVSYWTYTWTIPFLTAGLRDEALQAPAGRFERALHPESYYYVVTAMLLEAQERSAEARIYYDSARIVLEEAVQAIEQGELSLYNDRLPGDLYVRLGQAHAGLGQRDDAIRATEHGLSLRTDPFFGTLARQWVAEIYARVGDQEAAIDELEYLLSIPSFLSAPQLRVHPAWDPLRDHPRFQALLEKYEPQS